VARTDFTRRRKHKLKFDLVVIVMLLSVLRDINREQSRAEQKRKKTRNESSVKEGEREKVR
jgi:hypothetical protein